MASKKKKLAKKMMQNFWITVFFSLTFAVFVILGWRLLFDAIDNTLLAFLITGGIVLIGIALGQFKFKSVVKKLARA